MKRGSLIIGWLVGAVLLQVPATAQTPRTSSPVRRPQIWAIIVGVGNPLDPKIRAQSSRETVQQASDVLRWFTGVAGWDRRNLLLLTDFGGNANPGLPQSPAPNITPSKQNLDWAFREWLAPRAQPGDIIIFYFAGQARAVVPAGAPVFPEYFLVPTDVLADNLSVRGWSLDRALDRYAKQGKFQIVCWLGTTLQVHQAAIGGIAGPADLARLSRDWLLRLARWPGVTVWLASDRPPPTPAADPAIPFTKALLQGLGNKDREQNLAACLQTLHRDSKLKLGGFQSVGGVPPGLTLWADQLGVPVKQSQPEMVVQVGHADRIHDIVSTSDSRMLMTASQDSTVRVWSPGQKALLRVLNGHAVGVTALGLSSNGQWLVSGGGRGEILIHDLTQDFTRRSVARQPYDEGSRVEQIAMLPDGTHFVTIDSKGFGFLWDLGKPSLTLERWIQDSACRKVASGGSGGKGIVAALCGDGTVRLFDSSGAGGVAIPVPGGHPSAITVSWDGRLLGVGCENGLVVVRDIIAGRQIDQKLGEGSIDHLAFSHQDLLAVGDEKGVRLIEVKAGPTLGRASDLLREGGAEKLTFSPDGRLLAACTRDGGTLHVWRIDSVAQQQSIVQEPPAGVVSLAFSCDGRNLITGTKLGSVKTWPLEDRGAAPSWTIPANRGKVQHVSTSPGRRFLLVINELHQAYLWDLAQRSCRRLAGTWSSGAFQSDDVLVLADRPGADQPGRLVRIDRRTMALDGAFFARSSGEFKVPSDTRFNVVTLSPDGTKIAASAGGSQIPLVCVWETATGLLTHWITDAVLNHPAFSLSFSSDGRELVAAGDSTQAELWDLSRHRGAIEAPAVTFQDATSRDITYVQIRPGRHRQMVSGHSDGRLLLWSWGDGKTRQQAPSQILAERYFNGAVHAVTFTPEGRYLAAVGDGTMIWLAEMEPRVRQIRDLGTPPHHFEQINALAVWPGSLGPLRRALFGVLTPGLPVIAESPRPTMLISGSDDTTIRFWDLDKHALLGTFCAASTAAESGEPAGTNAVRELDWVLYTPDGHFDASEAGRELVRFRHGDHGHALEQFDGTKLYSFELTDHLSAGMPVEPARLDPPPPVAIDPPLRDDPTQSETKLTVLLGAADFKDVRLYHNGVPIPSGHEDSPLPLPDRFEVPVRLLPGLNRFYAMASREGAFDSRSQEVEIPYEGTVEPGRLHVIALGVGNYEREKLSFAKSDAERLSEVLHLRGLAAGKERGKSVLLTDDLINARSVAKAFTAVGREVKGRPQDTVVLFLAGHTGVFDNERFCLLLPKYPFPKEAPIMVAARNANPPVAPGAKISPDDLLPYTMLAVNLMRLDALNRLVIVDACQAEAILSDPQVEAIRKWMEIGSRRARTSYLMAARRGEPALEVEPLRHGLFTFTLLRGMREIGPREEPAEIAGLKLRADADYNGDGLITTAELDAYVKESLPPIANLFPQLMVKQRALNAPAAPQPAQAARLDQSLRLQTARTSFPLIRLSLGTAAGP